MWYITKYKKYRLIYLKYSLTYDTISTSKQSNAITAESISP
nr:MAG TPA: hypothetical protein [Caudoviricetes sp.]